MNHRHLLNTGLHILNSLVDAPPATFKGIPEAINTEMNNCEVPFGDRKYVAMVLADLANGKAAAIGGASAKLLRKIGDKALDLHARWAGVGFWDRRATRERETRQELTLMSREARELDGKREIVNGLESIVMRAIEVAAKHGAFAPSTIDARTTVNMPEPTKAEPVVAAKPARDRKVGPQPEPPAVTGA